MQISDYHVEIIPDAEFRLDGGAMFGVVPRNLWAQVCPPDDQNRIRMNMNCVFVDTGVEKVLIETGIGDKWSAKESLMYGIKRERTLIETLRQRVGVEPEDISIVVNTHLHFDHAGGNTTLNISGTAIPTFPNARYFVSSAELEHAENPTERDRASYLPENWRPVLQAGQFEGKDADYEVVPGLRMETHPGHNRSMQCWRLCLVLQISYRCGRMFVSHGSWASTSIRSRRLNQRKDCCRKQCVRSGCAFFIMSLMWLFAD